jgi:hypothetical protein
MHVVGRRKWPDFLVDLLMADKDRVSPCLLEFHKPTLAVCGGAKRGVRPSHRLGSRVHSALHLTIWSGSVSVVLVLERRAWRMLVQEDNILPDN